MRIVCAWCEKDLGFKADPNDLRVSHGICPSCRGHLEASLDGIPLRQFLDTLAVPVAMVDEAMHVVYANPAAQTLLKEPPAPIEGQLGRVFECESSYLPDGCGKAPDCSACALRHAVTRCYDSGRAEDDVVTTIKRRIDDGAADLTLHLSTKRIDDLVLLRIDGIVR